MVQIGDLNIKDFPLLLAPMEDVTDQPFRSICKDKGCDMMFTEFVSVEGLSRDVEKSLKKVILTDYERPIGIQIFGSESETMIKAVQKIEKLKPDVIDINFGCPVKKIVCKGNGAAILKDIPKMVSICKQIVQATEIPVTVKTRLGWDEENIRIEEIVIRLQEVGIKAITIHARTRSQMYSGNANWDYLKSIKSNNEITIPIFGNGDIDSPSKAFEYKNKYKVDGLMIGRAAIGNPWIFREIKHYFKYGTLLPKPEMEERIETVKTHVRNSVKWKGERTGLLEMRPHYSNYFKAFPHFKEFKIKLMSKLEVGDVLKLLDSVYDHYKAFQIYTDEH